MTYEEYYNALRFIHPVGLPIRGIVIAHDKYMQRLVLKTSSEYSAVLPYDFLLDNYVSYPDVLPEIGATIDAIVANYKNGTFYLSAKPADLKEERIEEYREFHRQLDNIGVWGIITATVQAIVHFGIFVDAGLLYPGLIDIGHTRWISGHRLPKDRILWPKPGETVRCIVGGVRFHERQLDLGWLPDDAPLPKQEEVERGS